MDRVKRRNYKYFPGLFRLLLVVGVIAFISLLFPTNVKFKYEFEKGQTWRHENLYAPFDFAIRKPETVVRAERQEILQTLKPVYRIDTTVAPRQEQRFLEAFNQRLESVKETGQFAEVVNQPTPYRAFGIGFLQRIYDRGVIQDVQAQTEEGEDFIIALRQGSALREQPVDAFLNVGSVKSLLNDTMRVSRLARADFILPILEDFVVPNIVYDDSLTNRLREQALETIPAYRGSVDSGSLIIGKGDVITDDAYQRLISYRERYTEDASVQRSYFGVFVGYCILTGLVVTLFVVYLRFFAPVVYSRFHKLVFVMMWLVVYSYLVFIVEETEILSPYLIPFCIVPIVVKTFFNERLALFTHIVNVLIASFLTSLGYEFAFLQLSAGIVVILSDVDTRDWSRYFNSLLYIFVSYSVAYLGLSLIEEGDIRRIDYTFYLWIGLNVFLTLLAYPLIPLVERVFGFVSPITLVELSDMNRPLLRELALRAPGTLQHSLQVANMAEQAARRIGANPLLVKVGALYHDIGKTVNPAFFIENQGGRNPHEDISNLRSAEIIIGHVPEGVQMAKKSKLPAVLVDFIRTHHGTTRVEYFYRNYQKEHPDEPVDESLFRYPGPRPSSKEETILMLADSVEAACKSLKNPTEAELYETIDRVINFKVNNDQLDDSQMSFRELEECRHVFRSFMKSAHHLRIEYPEDEEERPRAKSVSPPVGEEERPRVLPRPDPPRDPDSGPAAHRE